MQFTMKFFVLFSIVFLNTIKQSSQQVKSMLGENTVFTTSMESIRRTTPSWYSYIYDDRSPPVTQIQDGGNDMYDGGNRIYVRRNNALLISEAIYNQTYKYSDFSFFTYAGHPFVAIMNISGNRFTPTEYQLQVLGNAGADGSGNYNTFKGCVSSDAQNTTINYFVAQISGAFNDPSICQVLFIISSSSFGSAPTFAKPTFGEGTNNINIALNIGGTPSQVIMGYILLSKARGVPFSSHEIQLIMRKVLDGFGTGLLEIVSSTLGTNRVFTSSMANIRRTTPSWYSYIYDDRSPPVTHIRDGGRDMYDTGNRIFVRRNNELVISEATYNQLYKFTDFSFSTYAGHPFVALMNIRNYGFTATEYQLQVLGNPGSDGFGSHNTFRGSVSNSTQAKTMNYFVSQISGASDPSICQVFFVISSSLIGRGSAFTRTSFNGGTTNINISLTVGGNPLPATIGYILLSKTRGLSFSTSETRQIMQRVLNGFRSELPTIVNSLLRTNKIFTTSMANIRRTTSSWYSYIYDDRTPPVTQIVDGGNDMYDGGNKIFVRRNNELLISEATYNKTYKFKDFSFSTYAGHPFVALMNIRNYGFTSTEYQLQVRGNAGADGSGNYNTFEGSVSSSTQDNMINYFVSQISGARDPSICQVFFVISSRSFGRGAAFTRTSFTNGTNNIDVSLTIGGNPFRLIMGYILLSKARGVRFYSYQIRQIMLRVVDGLGTELLETVDSKLGTNTIFTTSMASIRRTTSSWYSYIYDDRIPPITQISDGGSDMYDGGNKISVRQNNELLISEATYNKTYIFPDFIFSTYAGHPFVAIMNIRNNGLTSKEYQLQVLGNAGADGRGNYNTFRGSITSNTQGNTMNYFVSQISGTSDPSICQVFFVITNPSLGRAPSFTRPVNIDDTNNINISLTIKENSMRVIMGYILLSKARGQSFSSQETLQIMRRVLDNLGKELFQIVNSLLRTNPVFTTSMANIRRTTSSWYSYIYDDRTPPVTRINDGGNDMYDGGNRIFVRRNNELLISEATYNQRYIFKDFSFTTYNSHPFVAVMNIKNYRFTSTEYQLQVLGNAGADGRGNYNTFRGSISSSTRGNTMNYFVSQISGTSDPSICQVFFVISNPSYGRPPSFTRPVFSNGTNNINISLTIGGTPSQVIMGYILLSKSRGLSFSSFETRQIMRQVLDGLGNELLKIVNSLLGANKVFTTSLANIRRTTSSWYSYIYDDRTPPVTRINDGGNDMYDGGNRIFVRRNNDLLISEATYNKTYIHPDFSFSTYAGHPFVALMNIRNYGLTSIEYQLQVLGNAGADGRGNYNTFRGSVFSSSQFDTMNYFVSQISGTSDPSICQVFFVISSRSSRRRPAFPRPSFSNGTNNINISLTIRGNQFQAIMGYILLSKTRGLSFSTFETRRIMQRVLDDLDTELPKNEYLQCREHTENIFPETFSGLGRPVN